MAAKKKASAKKAAAKKAAGTRRSTRARRGPLPPILYANASPRSIGGTSLFDTPRPPTAGDAMAFASEEAVIRSATARLQAAGFSVLGISPHAINIAAPPELYEQVFGATLVTEERDVIKGGQVEDTATFVECPDTDLPGLIPTAGSGLNDVLEGVAIEEPIYFMESAFAPTKEYWHLDVPGDVAAGLNAEKAHRRGYTGKNVKVVMVDSGWYRHPYFTKRGYRSSPVVLGPAAADPTSDESGHGTGESANLFAVAPDVDFTMVKVNFVNSVGAFNTAVALGPDIISNSWGSSIPNGPLSATNLTLATAVANAWASGIVVVFSAGNGHWGFPGQHPDIISAGGVFMDDDESLRASDYASGFASNIYAGRNVPDLSGLVGMRPGAEYIMLPVEPGDSIDVGNAGGTHPGGDETTEKDGWAAFSGTSAAAPQLAGVAALMRQACNRLTPAQIRSMMMSTATDVTAGTNHPNFSNVAVTGYDLATGAGLADADKSVLRARLACLTMGRIRPIIIPPVAPIMPVGPIAPGRPVIPVAPVSPIRPPIGSVVRYMGEESPADEAFEAALRANVETMAAAGYPAEQIDAWLEEQLAGQVDGITPEEGAALEQAILDGEDLDL